MATRKKRLKYYTVVIDGIDKTGKDTIAAYVWRLEKTLNVLVRGWPSLEAYNRKFERNVIYDLPPRRVLYVHLDVDKTDWEIRCKLTNEPPIDFAKDSKLFDDAFDILNEKGYHTLYANTSHASPYEIAMRIINEIQTLNNKEK